MEPNFTFRRAGTAESIQEAQNRFQRLPFEKQLRCKVHCVIQPPHLRAGIANLARTRNAELPHTLQAGFRFIQEESSESTLDGSQRIRMSFR